MNITKLTEQYISTRPSVKDALKKGLVNYSSLSRQVCKDAGIKRFDAVLIACRRYYMKVKKEASLHESEIICLMKSAKLRIRNKIEVIIVEKPRDMETVYSLQKSIRKRKGDFNLIEGEDAITLITNSEFLSDIKSAFKGRVIKLTSGLVRLSLSFDERIETTSGVVSYVYNLFSESGINILEEMSCWTDIMVIIDEKDLQRAMGVLRF